MIIFTKTLIDAISYNYGPIFLPISPLKSIAFNFILGFAATLAILKDGKSNFVKYYPFFAIFILATTPLLIYISGVEWYADSSTINLYQTFSVYYFRILILLIILYMISRKEDNLWCIFMLLILFIFSFIFCLYTGAKKELVIPLIGLSFAVLKLIYRFFNNKKLSLFINACLLFIVAIYIPSLFDKIGSYYIFEIIERSLMDRITLIEEHFMFFLNMYPWIGNHFSHVSINAIYIHSTPLNLLTSYGVLIGSFLVVIVYYNLVSNLRINFFGVILMSVIIISIIATSYDWMLLWFTLGCVGALSNFKFHYGEGGANKKLG